MGIAAGSLRHRVSIQQPTNTQNAITGEVSKTWTTIHACVPCAIEPLSVRDFQQSRATQSSVSVRVVMRHMVGITSSMRLVATCGCHEGNIYNPEGILEDTESGREYITLPCSQGVNEG